MCWIKSNMPFALAGSTSMPQPEGRCHDELSLIARTS